MMTNKAFNIVVMSTAFLLVLVCLSFARTDHRDFKGNKPDECRDCHSGSGVMSNHGPFFMKEHRGATSHDVLRGSLATLRSTGGNFATPTVTQLCLADNRPETFWLHTEAPLPDDGVWYLVRSNPSGSWDSGAPTQAGSRDAEIAASGNGCP